MQNSTLVLSFKKIARSALTFYYSLRPLAVRSYQFNIFHPLCCLLRRSDTYSQQQNNSSKNSSSTTLEHHTYLCAPIPVIYAVHLALNM